MLINELLNKIDFHDSNVISLYHKENNLIIKLDLCMWKQKSYKKGEKELKEISLKFSNVEQFKWDSEKYEKDIEYETILNFSYDGKMAKIVLEDDNISIITFKCSCVEFLN